MNLEKLKDTARKHEQKEDWRRAIEVYNKAIQEFESGRESAPDLSLYNRVGDLHIKLNDPASAVRSYERAADLYGDQGFLNNAIALCGKILRVNPGRVQTYLKLAQLHARKNVVSEAKRNLIEYIERMNALNQLDDAFRSVKSFADQFSSNQDIRLMLVELLRAASRDDEAREQLEKMAADLEARGDRDGARATRERLNAIDIELPDDSAVAAAPPELAKNDLIFLDTGFGTPARPAEPVARAEGLIPDETPVFDETAAALELMAEESGDYGAASADVSPMTDLEPVVADGVSLDFDEPVDGLLLDSVAELEADADGMALLPMDGELGIERNVPVDLALDDGDEPRAANDADADLMLEYSESGASADTDDDDGDPVPLDVSFAGAEMSDALWHREEVEADAEVGDSAVAPELPYIEDLSAEAPAVPMDELTQPAEVADPGLSIVDLEEAVLDDPHNPQRHRALADALLTNDESERAREEYELALEGYAQQESWRDALDAVDALIWLDPDSIRYQQKRVEMAFRSGDRGRLLDAYLHLGDTLAREGAIDKAMAVYGRVIEHEPNNARAQAAIAAIEVPAEPPPVPVVGPAVPRAQPARLEPAAETPGPAGFVDFGGMVMEPKRSRDTRMRVEGERPTGDEQRDFQETLNQFKRGIEQNLDSDDYEAHYDLGVAFREMGLLDEAIAEFQKALRAPEGRLRTAEALGLTFFDKGQFAVAETVLRRAVDGSDGADDEKIGALYWLGRAAEAQDKRDDAVASYERALAVDIRFMDISERVQRLVAGRRQ